MGVPFLRVPMLGCFKGTPKDNHSFCRGWGGEWGSHIETHPHQLCEFGMCFPQAAWRIKQRRPNLLIEDRHRDTFLWKKPSSKNATASDPLRESNFMHNMGDPLAGADSLAARVLLWGPASHPT